MTTFDQLKDAINKYKDTEYVPVKFPMSNFNRSSAIAPAIGFVSADGNSIAWFKGLTPDGLTYLLYRLGNYVNDGEFGSIHQAREFARELYRKDKNQFVQHINRLRQWQEIEEYKRKDKPLIVAHQNLRIEGLLTHYNPVSHRQVVEQVGMSKIKERLTDFYITPKDMTLYFRSKFIVNKRMAFGMAIRNGETGHVTLSYHMYVSSDDYVFFTPMKMKRRHLSKVGEVYATLEDILETAASVEVDQILANTASREFLPLLSNKKYDKIRDAVAGYSEQPAEELISRLFTLRSERGYKTVATQALDVLFAKAFSLI